MQFGTIGTEYKYDLGNPAFRAAFAFLNRDDLADLPEGWVELGHGARADVQRYTTSPAAELSFETHEKFFDIQYLIEGDEYLGVCTRAGLVPKTEYEIERDVTFYHDPDRAGQVLLHGGDYVIFAPEDAHKPRCLVDGAMEVRKIVVKVPVE